MAGHDWPAFDDIPPGAWECTGVVADLRRFVWARGFRPVPVYGRDCPDWVASPCKQPAGDGWQEYAQMTPPPCATVRETDEAWVNTGIWCGGLRAIDLDCDDASVLPALRAAMVRRLGASPCVRYRRDSPRVLAVYAALEGQPGKLQVGTKGCAVECLGLGQQFVAFGWHPGGELLRWEDGGAPGWVARAELPAVGEDRVRAFLEDATAILGVQDTIREVRPAADDGWRPGHRSGGDMPIQDVRLCLSRIPRLGGSIPYGDWLRIGMATHHATGGSAEGLEAWRDWSGGDPACAGKWRSFGGAGRVTAGTLIHLAREHYPGLRLTGLPPAHPLDWAALQPRGRAAMRRLKKMGRAKG